jgi:hypothetical protein
MRTRHLLTLLLALPLTGCMAPMGGSPGMMAGGSGMPDMKRMEQQQALMQKLMSDPQVPAWYQQREKIAMAMGDRVFDKPFDRVFDSMTVALATMEANVNNMERASGYITSAVPKLPPEKAKALQRQQMVEVCQNEGFDPAILDKKGPYEIDLESMSQMSRMQQAMTISLVRQGPNQTKVKIRFSNVNYPAEVTELYRQVWPAIDKQIFLDRNVD